MKSLLVLLVLSFAGCSADPHRDVAITFDPETKTINGTLDSGWMAGPTVVIGRYRSPEGVEIDILWASNVDLSAVVADRKDARDTLAEIAEQAAQAARGLK